MSFSIKKAGTKSSSVVPLVAKPAENAKNTTIPVQPVNPSLVQNVGGRSIRRSLTLNENYR